MANHIHIEIEYRPSSDPLVVHAVRILNTGRKPVVLVMEEQKFRLALLPGRNIIITGGALEKFK